MQYRYSCLKQKIVKKSEINGTVPTDDFLDRPKGISTVGILMV
jgi:hypothetical protein